MSEFHKLIYTSTSVQPHSEAELQALMVQARQKNQDFGITGCLIYYKSKFIQYLEGRKCLLEHVFSSIIKDTRHQNVQVLCRRHVDWRAFKEWSMALKYIPEGEINNYQNANALFEDMMNIDDESRLSSEALTYYDHFLHEASRGYGSLAQVRSQ